MQRGTQETEDQTPGLLGKKQRRLLNEVTKQKDFVNPFLRRCRGQRGRGENGEEVGERVYLRALRAVPGSPRGVQPRTEAGEPAELSEVRQPPSVRATLRDSAASRRLGGARKARSAQRLGAEERSKVRVHAWSKRQYSSLRATPQEVAKMEALVPMRMEFIVELGCVCPRKQILRRRLLRCPRTGWHIWKSCWTDKV
ncbi:unnamed protein product [Rangifer tarandus platyrhynchus]|uniref:Uncharacterized protein n=2 Tax=Rangifer tarandus platyrhynchus TaxID=3082113 RepID=A0ACB0EEC0_RANTA|nr:unnamed protein product [Rangifer tarandus platyrhynchus]CAI9698609.1 unnamed protein product [Rangifer tarandus platyrhynchus]